MRCLRSRWSFVSILFFFNHVYVYDVETSLYYAKCLWITLVKLELDSTQTLTIFFEVRLQHSEMKQMKQIQWIKFGIILNAEFVNLHRKHMNQFTLIYTDTNIVFEKRK